jgi:phosphatidate cytidylyltransferase
MFWEWNSLLSAFPRSGAVNLGALGLVFGIGLAADGYVLASLMLLAAAALGAALTGRRASGIWVASSIPYCASVALAPIILRSDPEYGFAAIIFLFAIVWGTDVVAYFAGRALGGPKLCAPISPNKTWSGAMAGTVAAVLAGVIVGHTFGLAESGTIGVLAAMLSIFGQAGDLLESFLKRRFGAKDSGRLIPGHGGLMDRLDAFLAAGVVAVLIGVIRGGLQAPGRGLLVW